MTTAQQSGFYIQTPGQARDLVVPHRLQGLVHYSRGNKIQDSLLRQEWAWPEYFGENDVIGDASLIQSHFDTGNLEVVARRGDQLMHFWRSIRNGGWNETVVIPGSSGVKGYPALIQSSFPYPGNPDYRGNFEVVVPLALGGLAHFWRDNQTAGFPWHGPTAVFGSGSFDAVALIQSSVGPGNFEVVARQGSRLFHFWRDARTFQWNGPTLIDATGGITGNPSLIQTTYGTFLAICPRSAGGMAIFYRNNNAPGYPWTRSATVLGTGSIAAVSVIEASSGYYEMIAKESDHLAFYWLNANGGHDGPFYVTGFDSTACPMTAASIPTSLQYQDARFGLYIHWGVYSVVGNGEWYQGDNGIDAATYKKKCVDKFNPNNYSVANWIQLAASTGMKYITFTSKHHDGFAMWPSQYGDFNLTQTKWDGNPVGDLAAACHPAGLKLFLYYSLLDWHNADYSAGNWDAYTQFVHDQVTELLTKYPGIDGIWLDGQWDKPDVWNEVTSSGISRLAGLYALVQQLNPAALVATLGQKPLVGDSFAILEEGYFKANPGDDLPHYKMYGGPTFGHPWPEWKWNPVHLPLETCETILYYPLDKPLWKDDGTNAAAGVNYVPAPWGYAAGNQVTRTAKGFSKPIHFNLWTGRDLILKLVKAAGANSNFLLNVGPKANGTVQQDFLNRLERIGQWMGKGYAASIYNTRGGPLTPTDDYAATQSADSRVVYLHFVTAPAAPLSVPEIPGVTRVRSLLSGNVIPFHVTGGRLVIDYVFGAITEPPFDTVLTFVLDREIP
ncbi:MAG TPA: alpha-L-fucosidase [Bryobacteraceae bacterium]|nr:alpha-L-fucosidase [Bryobacteraceae bacterium]